MPARVARSITQSCGDRIILYRWSLSDEFKLQNLVCLSRDGSERWRALLPERVSYSDCFVDLRHDAEQVIAVTYSGYEIHLDPGSGERMRMARAA